jgi:hypothetical protein
LRGSRRRPWQAPERRDSDERTSCTRGGEHGAIARLSSTERSALAASASPTRRGRFLGWRSRGARTAPGDYSATICIASNDPQHPSTPVPIALHVGASDTIFADGFDGAQ